MKESLSNLMADKKKKWIVIGVVVFVILGIAGMSGNQPTTTPAPVANNPAPAIKTSFLEGLKYKTASGVEFKIKKARVGDDRLNIGIGEVREPHEFYNYILLGHADKNDKSWHDKIKAVNSHIVKERQDKKIATTANLEDGTNIMNWNMDGTKTILYTYPVEEDEREVFNP